MVHLRCPPGAASACRGTLSVALRRDPTSLPGKRVGARRITVAPGRRADVVVPLSPAVRRRLQAHTRLFASVVLVPSADSMAGAVQYGLVLTS